MTSLSPRATGTCGRTTAIPYEVISKNLLCVFGPVQKCIDTIQAYKESGADYFIVRFASPDQARQFARFTEEVLPAVG